MRRGACRQSSLITRSLTAGTKVYKKTLRESSFAESADLTDKFGAADLTLSRSAGSVYYFNGSGVLTATGDNVAAFTSNGLFIEGQATNLIAAANYRDISTWTSTDTNMASTTPTLIDGTTGTSGKNEVVEGLLPASEHRRTITFTAATAAKQSVMVAVKRGTGTRHVQVRIGNATDGIYGAVAINLDTLAEIGTGTWEYFTAYVKGAYTIIELVDTNTTTGTQTLYVNLHDGTSNSYLGDNASSLIVDWAQVVTSGLPNSHIQGAATRYSSHVTRPWIGATNNFWIYVDFYILSSVAFVPTAIFYYFSIYKDASDNASMRVLDTTGKARTSITKATVNTAGDTGNISFSRGDRIRAVFNQSSSVGMVTRINHNSVAYTSSLTTAAAKNSINAFSNGATLSILNDSSVTGRVMPCEIRSYKVGTGVLTTAQMAEMVGI